MAESFIVFLIKWSPKLTGHGTSMLSGHFNLQVIAFTGHFNLQVISFTGHFSLQVVSFKGHFNLQVTPIYRSSQLQTTSIYRSSHYLQSTSLVGHFIYRLSVQKTHFKPSLVIWCQLLTKHGWNENWLCLVLIENTEKSDKLILLNGNLLGH